MVTFQYPHHLYLCTETESTRNENGSWTPVKKTWTYTGSCRIEISNPGNETTSADGRYIKHSAEIYMPRRGQMAYEGQEVTVTAEEIEDLEQLSDPEQVKALVKTGKVIKQGTCKSFLNGRLHKTIWI